MILTPGNVTLGQLEAIWRDEKAVCLDPSSHTGILDAHALVGKAAAGEVPVYGINTGFGKLAPLQTSPILRQVINIIRSAVPALKNDRCLSDDIGTMSKLVRVGFLVTDMQMPAISKTDPE